MKIIHKPIVFPLFTASKEESCIRSISDNKIPLILNFLEAFF